MRRRPYYTQCKLFCDGIPQLDVGHFLRTDGGSAYLVQSMRQDRKRPQRRHLVCLRWPVDEIPADAVVHSFYWYPRRKRRAVTLQQFQARQS